MTSWKILAIAFILDFVFGDPRFFPHPIRWMGKGISVAEGPFRRLPIHPILSGLAFTAFLIAGTWFSCRVLLDAAGLLHPLFETVLELLLVYYSLSARSLADAGTEVLKPLRNGRLRDAREKLGQIVGRDVEDLEGEKIAKAAVESVAENLVDGVVAPLFYAALGGAPLAMAYKMVNTLDSRIGYLNETYRHFGKAAARIDDATNLLPARLSVPFISMAAQILAQRGRVTLKTGFREGGRHASPNSGYPEAAFAGALGVTLGGPSTYMGVLVDKPYLGDGLGKAYPVHIQRACDLMLFSAVLWGGFLTGAAALAAV